VRAAIAVSVWRGRFGAGACGSRESERMRMRLLTLREVAQYLQVHPGTVYRLVKAGQLRAARVGRDLRFDVRELDDWVAKGGTANSQAVRPKR